jgi:glycosyltransferase involved in cell wall biosynthesis
MVQAVAIMPVYNEERMLPFCIKHLSKNGIQHILVLDNESTDKSLEIALDYGASVISFSSNGLFCEETITRCIRNSIRSLPENFNWILKVDADEFIYSSKPNETIIEFIERNHENGFNCIGSFSHQTYPMAEEIDQLKKQFDPVNLLKHVIPHIKNDKYSTKDHPYSKCIWKVNVFNRSLSYRNPHYVDGRISLARELLLLKHVPYTIPEITVHRLIDGRKRRLSKRNFEIGLSTHYVDLSNNSTFIFDHIRSHCFDWDGLYESYFEDFESTLNLVAKRLKV